MIVDDRGYCVYKHTFPNGLVYYGITRREPDQRWLNGNGYRFGLIAKALQEYSWEEVKHEVLASGLTEADAKRIEKELIECSTKGTTLNVGYTANQEQLIGGEESLLAYCDTDEYFDIKDEISERFPLPCYEVMIYSDRAEIKMINVKTMKNSDVPIAAYSQEAVAYYPEGFMRRNELIPWIRTAEFALHPMRCVELTEQEGKL